MKTFLKLFLLPLLLFLYLLPVAAQEWSTEQKEVVKFLNDYTKVSMKGDMDEVMSYFHADFISRVYANTMSESLDRDGVQMAMEAGYQNYKILEFEVQPLIIQIHGDLAIAYTNFKETLRDTNGVDNKLSGPWTATLVKQDKGWIFLSWTWLYAEN
jgi:ketosteroid isomerase-like protein